MQKLQIELATAQSAKRKIWANKVWQWEDFVERIRETHYTHELYAAYGKMPKAEQSDIKDVGGYIGGYLQGGKRNPENVIRRKLLTLDLDFARYDFWDDFTMMYDNTALLHSTHKHSKETPRYRLLVPLNRDVAQDEYQAVARKFAEEIGLEMFDPSTFEINRLMFWPSTSKDGEYIFQEQEGPLLDVDYYLSLYQDWKNIKEWPRHESADKKIFSTLEKQADPRDKQNIVGTFCRTFSIYEVIDKYLSDVYLPTDDPDRYTYSKGTTAAGAVVYEDGLYLHSFHSTDPCAQLTCNAWDLVRIHKFGNEDIDSKQTGVKLPSYKLMEDFALSIGDVKTTIFEERKDSVLYDFGITVPVSTTQDVKPELEEVDVIKELKWATKDVAHPTANNLNIIFQYDPILSGRFVYNSFENKRYVVKDLPWRTIKGMELMVDTDYNCIRNYIDVIYGISACGKIDDALALTFTKNRINPVHDFLSGLKWDGKKRIDSLLVDYFGAVDNQYTHEAIRKSLVAAVARIYQPGIKFDSVLVLCGAQGTKKSSFFHKLGKDWFSDTFTTVQGKESFEQLQGKWIIEMGELAGLRKAEVESIKHFIAKQQDNFRPAYGRTTENFPRQCVFFGTTNNHNFLRDPSGNRRFWPIDVVPHLIRKDVWGTEFQESIDQIWAEAVHLYKAGESLLLSNEAEELANIARGNHSDTDERSGIVLEYIDMLVPEGWEDMNLEARRRWMDTPELRAKGLYQRDYISVAEVWCECLGKEKEDMTRFNTRDIPDILRQLPGWEMTGTTKYVGFYGRQRCYVRSLM
mgnify:CR=1 FL=1